jgi:mycothiol system anti-sigma-R factor
MIDCREAVRRMWSYLDDALAPKSLSEFEEHLDTCVRCCGELEFSRHVRERVATSEAPPTMPPEVRSRFERILLLDPDAKRQTRR